jgi:predicted dehydrogenase
VQPIRAGIVGVGKIARDHHLPSIRANSAFELVAAASRNATVEGVANYHSIEEMLQGSPEIDAVSICTPPQFHYMAAKAVLLRGKHVLMEKPPCASIAQLEALRCLAKKAGRTLYQTWHSQYVRAVPEAARLLRARRLVRAEITWKESAEKWHSGQGWLWMPEGLGCWTVGSMRSLS